MKFQTSFYMSERVFDKLQAASHRTGESICDLISQMMYRYAKDHKARRIAVGTVKYQDRDVNENWKVFRVALDEDDYELYTDMRKVLKRSVSFIIALAVEKYLEAIVNALLEYLDCYSRLFYAAKGKDSEDHVIWIYKWRIEQKIPTEKLIHQE